MLFRSSFRAQLEYLRERSAFYRERLEGFDGGLAAIARLPLTEKGELRETVTRESPFGAHFCAEPHELVRIYSTSGTTGTPSYIPLTAGDLENWVAGSARSYAASGVVAGQRIVSTYNAGPFVAGAALGAFDRIGLTHVPVGTGNTERLVKAIELLVPRPPFDVSARTQPPLQPPPRAPARSDAPAPRRCARAGRPYARGSARPSPPSQRSRGRA